MNTLNRDDLLLGFKALMQDIVNHIDSGAGNDHPIKVTNGELCNWYDRLEVFQGIVLHGHAQEGPELAEAYEKLNVLEDILCDVQQFLEGELPNAKPGLITEITAYFEARKAARAISTLNTTKGSQE